MAKARMYGWSEKRFSAPKRVAELKGQAGVVRDVLDSMTNAAHDANPEEPTAKFLASEVTAKVIESGRLVTRQDALRVVLYYLLVLKKRGFVAAAEAPADLEDETENIETEETENIEAE